jgi:Flp pilus assembly pilin Flp
MTIVGWENCETHAPALRREPLAGDERGANVVEYIVLVAVIALGALAGYRAFGKQLDAKLRCAVVARSLARGAPTAEGERRSEGPAGGPCGRDHIRNASVLGARRRRLAMARRRLASAPAA